MMTAPATDEPTDIRVGEELNTDILREYLESNTDLSNIDIRGGLEVKQFPRGFSNLTYLLRAGNREMVLRKPPHGADIKSAHDMQREFKVLSVLHPVYPYLPSPILYEEDKGILGSPFYLMERVKGIILRDRPPEGIDLNPRLMRVISEKAVDHLASLHQLDIASSGLSDFGKPEGYIQRQVEGWTKRYLKAETDWIKDMNETSEWLQSNMPTHHAAAFIHNDYKYDNLVLNPDNPAEIRAVLDWEMATVGDPLMDVGTTLGYWAEPGDSELLRRFNLTWLPGNLTREEVVARYSEKAQTDTSRIVFYYVFGCFKIGVIVQQIYARFQRGLTADPRFKTLIHVVHACAQNAANAVKFNRISNWY